MRQWKEDLRRAHDAVRARCDGPDIRRYRDAVCQVRKAKRPRTYTFTGTTSRAALDDGVLIPSGMDGERYDSNPVVLWAHDQSMPPIGRTVERRMTKEGWDFDVEFADTEDAREIEYLVENGFLRATSVGFRVTEYDRGAGAEVKKELGLSPNGWIGNRWQLLELSIVPVGADPGALMTASARRAALFTRAGATIPVLPTATDNRSDFNCPKPFETHDACVKAMTGKVDDPNAFCAAWAKACGEQSTHAKDETMSDEGRAEGDAPPPAEEPAEEGQEMDAMSEVMSKLDTIAEGVAKCLEMMSAKSAENETTAEPDAQESEPERSGDIYADLFAECKRANEIAQKVAR